MSKSAIDLTKYTGINADCGEAKFAAVLLENSTISRSIYRAGTVDHVFFDKAVVIREETVEALYSDFTPLDQPYTPGTRVFLEKVVSQLTAGLTSDRDKAIAILDWVRDIPDTNAMVGVSGQAGTGDAFHGGTEEEVIRKGSSMCNEQARVLCILSQIAGIPARYVGHMVPINYDDRNSGTGHGVNELYIEGAWAYFDIRGKFFLKADSKLASVWELIQDPSLIDKQPKEVLAHMRHNSSLEISKRWFSPGAVHIILNYFVADHAQYDYTWVYPSASLWCEAREKGRKLRTTKHVGIMPQPKPRIM